MLDKTTRRKILSYLYEMYRTSPYEIRDTEEISETLGIPFPEVKSELIYLHKKGFVDSYFDNHEDIWAQKINEKGIDELEKLEDETSAGIDHSLDVEVSQENFHGIMEVFISHKFEREDQKLALVLRKELRSKNIEGYLAETRREYELLIGDKIRGKIDSSDFVVGIITKESEKSASVNQELGYALGKGIRLVIMVEEGVPHGVLTHGRETEIFSRPNFARHCANVAAYILEKGKKRSIIKNNSGEYDLVLDKFTENGIHHVGIKNARGKTIKSCIVLCNYRKCEWWNTHDTFQRNFMEGEAANVILPRGFANTNPIIEIMSGDDIIEQVLLSEIAHRSSTKWDAEDENEDKVERLKSAINVIRSDLASLQSIFQFLLNPKEDATVTDEIRSNLDQKNWIVERLQTTVNQTAYLLDTDWTERINEICMLVKKHPVILPAYNNLLQTMNCQSCSGIVSQIVEVLKIMPNPPV